MADNITAPAAGAVLATDDIGGIHYPRTKLSFGADGSATDVSSASPLPVTGTFWPTTQPISGTVTVTGVATAAKQDDLIAAVVNQSSATSWFSITPADTNLATVPDAIYVGGAGTVIAKGSNGTDATFTAAAGQILPIRPTQVRAGSTASGIVGLVN